MSGFGGRTMRDVLIERLQERIADDPSLFFLTADLGAPALDDLRKRHPQRCLNVGIAEQNAIAIATGLALEGFRVFCYGIAPFITMRAYEQTRTNLALMAQARPLNVNILSLGVGFSYDVSGPTHHCVEDITLMRLLPNIVFFSPSDSYLTGRFLDYAIDVRKPKYLRLDGKPLAQIYNEESDIDFQRGFTLLRTGEQVCLVATGYTTHKALRIADALASEGVRISVLDLYMLKSYDEGALVQQLRRHRHIVTIEESFINKGGLDSLVASVVTNEQLPLRLTRFGLDDRYLFCNGGREYLHKAYGMDDEAIVRVIRQAS